MSLRHVVSVPPLRPLGCQSWWARPDAARPWHRRLLAPEELARADAYHRGLDRNRFIVGCAISRLVLGALTGTAAEKVGLLRRCAECGGPHGRPSLPGSRLHLSVAHSGNWVAVAVTSAGPVGIDVEYCDPDRLNAAPRVLAVEESALYDLLSGPERLEAFYTYWVRKEAILKATGDGLRIPMKSLRLSTPDDRPRLVSFASRPDLHVELADIAVDDRHKSAMAVIAPHPVQLDVLDASAILDAQHCPM